MKNKTKRVFSEDDKQYLVISKQKNRVYCCVESGSHHITCEEQRISEGMSRLRFEKLDEECDISQYPQDTYFILEYYEEKKDLT